MKHKPLNWGQPSLPNQPGYPSICIPPVSLQFNILINPVWQADGIIAFPVTLWSTHPKRLHTLKRVRLSVQCLPVPVGWSFYEFPLLEISRSFTICVHTRIGHRDFKNLCEVLIKFKLVDCSYWDFLPSQLFDWETSCQLSLQQRLYVIANKRDKVYVYSMCKHSAATFPLTGQRAKGCLRPMAVGGTYCPIWICYNPLKPLGFSHQLIPKSLNPSILLTWHFFIC